LKANGVVLKSDVLRAELKLSKQKLSLVELNNDLAIANQKLNILIGLPDEQKITPTQNNVLDSLTLKSNARIILMMQAVTATTSKYLNRKQN
jgi:outer membrane protein